MDCEKTPAENVVELADIYESATEQVKKRLEPELLKAINETPDSGWKTRHILEHFPPLLCKDLPANVVEIIEKKLFKAIDSRINHNIYWLGYSLFGFLAKQMPPDKIVLYAINGIGEKVKNEAYRCNSYQYKGINNGGDEPREFNPFKAENARYSFDHTLKDVRLAMVALLERYSKEKCESMPILCTALGTLVKLDGAYPTERDANGTYKYYYEQHLPKEFVEYLVALILDIQKNRGPADVLRKPETWALAEEQLRVAKKKRDGGEILKTIPATLRNNAATANLPPKKNGTVDKIGK